LTYYSTVTLSDNYICHFLPAFCRLNLSNFLYRPNAHTSSSC